MQSTQKVPAPTYDGPIFDGDAHVHEGDGFALFQKYLPRKYHADWLLENKFGPDGQYGTFLGGKRLEKMESNAEGLVPPPGKLKDWLREVKTGKPMLSSWIKPTPDMYDRDARVRKLDEFGVESSLMFPGSFIGTIAFFEKDIEAGNAVFHAYNEYLHDQWGFNHQDRIYSVGILNLMDLESSIKEAEWMIKRGLKIAVMPLGPAGGRAPADPYFDPLWARLNEAGVVLSFHVSEASFMHPLVHAFGEQPLQPRRTGQTAWQWLNTYGEVPLMMTLSSFIYLNFFERFPNMKICSVENGAGWVPRFLKKMDQMRGMAKNGFWPCGQLKERPSMIFKRNVYVVAYPEDEVKEIVDDIGTDLCILCGSDYPHAEGVPTPKDFVAEALGGLDAGQIRNIMYDNGRRMIPRA